MRLSDLNAYPDNLLKSEIVYDSLGRRTESRQYEGPTAYITVKQAYDVMGRVNKVSNPYRPGDSTAWTTTTFDALSRPISVTALGDGVVTSSYSGNRVLVADQAGKERISLTDGLGRLKDVWEVTAADSATDVISFPNHAEVIAGYHTSYSYDTLDNLTTVSQGSQTRTSIYDSLRRLSSATNPESGTISYQYDSNGNLTQKIDPRLLVGTQTHIAITYDYDALNRVKTRTYNDGTPAVSYIYDSVAENGKGRLASVSSSVSSYSLSGYDELGRALGGTQTMGAQSYTLGATYDLAGHVLTETYPSGNVVNYAFDGAGRLNSFSGNLGGGPLRTYANEFQYTALNDLQQEKFGTDTPLYHKQRYNLRGQLWDMRASTVSFANDPANGDRGSIVNYYSNSFAQGDSGADNNGNLLRQENYIPGSSFFQQNFAYDSLNRLTSVAEKLNGSGNDTFKQTYLYDRWGNRTIDQANTANISSLSFNVDANTNRLTVPSGQTGTMSYDNAGNLTTDSYSGQGQRTYDAENRMTSAGTAGVSPATYAYNSDGQRVRRNVDDVETWQIYGMDGELLAEYAAGASYLTPQKEYGYRNGQLLVTADAPAPAAATNGYAYRRTITVDHSKVPNTDRSDFPMLISGTYSYLATTANGGQVQNANGYDVIFTSDSGCTGKLNHEVETYNASSGAVNYWVKVPTVSHTTDTVLYMCYGDSEISSSQENKTGVWDASKVGVWHLPDGAVLGLNDSTSAALNLTNHSLAAAAGAVGGGASANGSSQYAARAANSNFNTDDYTVEAWIKRNGSGPFNQNAIIAHTPILSAGHYYVYVDDTSGKLTMDIPYVKGNLFFGATVMSTGVWYHVAVTKSGNNYVAYVNGQPDATVTDAATPTKAGDLTAASFQDTLYGGRYCNGTLDELRVSGTARSGDWIKSEYNNQSSPATFYSISAAGSGGSATENVAWTSVTGASASGNSLTKTAATGWGNAGAASTRSIASGDGYVEFSVSSLLTGMVALSHTDTNQDYTSMEFALLPNSDGNLYVFESGVNRGVVSTYTTSDVFRVAVEGGVVKYRKNGVLLYTSTVTPTYPLLVDAGLYHNGGTQANVVISGNLSGVTGGGGTTANINWLVTDQLGTPRMIFDQSGSLATTKRHDYAPFGEELLAGTGGRTTTQGYSGNSVRQKFTSKERDNETGLDFFEARYYSSLQGRFTSPDEFTGGPHEIFEIVLAPDALLYAEQTEPQSFNKYNYCLGNPLRYVDPDGHQTKQADALIVSTPATTERALNILVGFGKVVANIGIGMNNSVVGAKPVEPYRADNMTQGMTMVVTEVLSKIIRGVPSWSVTSQLMLAVDEPPPLKLPLITTFDWVPPL